MILESKTIRLRLVEEADAEFILSLRLDNRYNQFLSLVDSNLAGQISWIRSYKLEEKEKKQYYFVIERLDGVRCGTIRVYDLKLDSFCWGSWILNENKTRYSALESAFLIYQFGFEILGYNKSHFDVMKENKSVISFHKKMGANIVREDSINFYFEILKETVESTRKQIKEKFKL
ncbi:GNAT family N-acetyltransferase [Pseudomonas sp. F1_0610]|uniref:GNAT family N-acetyltransferase n=1 Tax=Pseudomonas sp. F1_0610 TaxID=3114284 RepID=UPI0039C36E76